MSATAKDAPTPAQVDVRDHILAERDKGNVVVMGLEGPMSMPLDDFVKQPADGILYDLNRLEEVVMTFIHERKWVNDFAVALVIRKLVEQRDAARAEIDTLPSLEEHHDTLMQLHRARDVLRTISLLRKRADDVRGFVDSPYSKALNAAVEIALNALPPRRKAPRRTNDRR